MRHRLRQLHLDCLLSSSFILLHPPRALVVLYSPVSLSILLAPPAQYIAVSPRASAVSPRASAVSPRASAVSPCAHVPTFGASPLRSVSLPAPLTRATGGEVCAGGKCVRGGGVCGGGSVSNCLLDKAPTPPSPSSSSCTDRPGRHAVAPCCNARQR